MLVKPDSPNDRATLGVDREAGDRAIASGGKPDDGGAQQLMHYGGGALGGIISAYFTGNPMTGYSIGSTAGDAIYGAASGKMNADDFVNTALAAKKARDAMKAADAQGTARAASAAQQIGAVGDAFDPAAAADSISGAL